MLPDRITPHDNLDLPPMPDAAWLLSQVDDVTSTPMGRKGRASNRDINLQEDFNNSQFLQDIADIDDELALAPMDDLELELDFGMDLDDRPSRMDKSVEMGRDAPAPRGVEDDIFSEMDMVPRQKGHDDREPSLALDFGDGAVRIADDEGDIMMGDDDFQFNLDDQSMVPGMPPRDMNRARISESPLSDIDEVFAKQVEAEYSRHTNADLYEPLDEQDTTIMRNPTQRAKKRKILVPDQQTMLSSSHIKDQQTNRDNIIRPQSFLPRDPYLLALMEMQKAGGFVSNIMLGGRSESWAPELRGLLSFETVRPTHDLKRKRDSGIADMDSDQGASKSPRLDLGDDDVFAAGGGIGNQSVAPDGTILEIPADDGLVIHDDDDGAAGQGSGYGAGFDDTTAPIVHPADSGPVSLGTKHAVHILRDLFGSEAATNADKRKKTSVVFQELLPEQRTTKAEATKMFFECLVLATKDAIKVEQGENLGAPIRVRGKRGLWGDWAEREAGGEIAHQMEPEPVVASVPAVSVEA
jgi:cohesin complex subunit SCC1